MILLSQLLDLLQAEPGLADCIDLETVCRYIRLMSTLKPDVLHHQYPSFDPKDVPGELPPQITAYAAARLSLTLMDVAALWRVLGMVIWVQGVEVLKEDISLLARDSKQDTHFGMFHCTCLPYIRVSICVAPCMVYPPIQICNAVYCDRRQLLRRKDPAREVTLFTLDRGICDALAANLYCYCK